MYSQRIYAPNTQAQTQMSVVHTCMRHAFCTCRHKCTVCLLAQTIDSWLWSMPPDQSSRLPLDLQRKHSFPTTGEGGRTGVAVVVGVWVLRHDGKNVYLQFNMLVSTLKKRTELIWLRVTHKTKTLSTVCLCFCNSGQDFLFPSCLSVRHSWQT